MNFVNHLQRINRLFRSDDRIKLEHVSLYSALFNWWYHHHKGDIVSISHRKMMRDSCIESLTLYKLILSNLHDYGYVTFSAGPPATIRISRLYTTSSEGPKLSNFKLPTIKDLPEDDSVMRQLVREIVDRMILLKRLMKK